jgi:hypothetical protein
MVRIEVLHEHEPMPVSGGRAASKCVNASSPPADAPMPTIGKGAPLRGSPRCTVAWSVVRGTAAVGRAEDGLASVFFVLRPCRAEPGVFRGREGTVSLRSLRCRWVSRRRKRGAEDYPSVRGGTTKIALGENEAPAHAEDLQDDDAKVSLLRVSLASVLMAIETRDGALCGGGRASRGSSGIGIITFSKRRRHFG